MIRFLLPLALIASGTCWNDNHPFPPPFRAPDSNPEPAVPDAFAEDISTDPYVFAAESLPTEDGTRSFPSIGNGHIATNVFTDTIYMNGLYNGYKGWSYRARIQSLHASNISVDDSSVLSQRFALDTRQGFFEQTLNTSQATVTYRTYAHSFYTRLLVSEVSVTRQVGVSGPITITRASLAGDDSTDFTWQAEADYNTTAFKQRQGTTLEAESDSSGLRDVFLYYIPMDDTWSLADVETENTFPYILAIDDVQDTARKHFDAGVAHLENDDLAGLRSLHTSNWREIWEGGRIELETTDLQLQKAVSGSLYYLYSNLPSHRTYTPNTQFYGLSPGGLANGRNGSDYYGHVFWDMETWMYPAILMLRPDLGADMLSYRIKGMDPAFDRAAEGGYSGTRFPWESAYTGEEVTPDICPLCRENQQHITGDIALAARQYVAATRDVSWLLDPSSPGGGYTGEGFVHEMARFWYTRPTWNATKERYEINGVMPPDEHQEDVKNSIYTNLLANYAIHTARWTACLAGRDPEATVPDRWLNVAQKLVFTFNEQKRYHEEFEGYDEEVETNQTDPRGIKQADVALLGFPLLWPMPEDVRRNDLLHYEPVTNPLGPAMTWSMFAIGWMDLGEEEKAQELFLRSYAPYVREPFKIWTEVQSGIGAVNFITGSGGFLQALVFGYGGLRLHPEVLEVRDTFLPANTTKLSLRSVDYLGSSLDLVFTESEMNVTLIEAGAEYNLTLEYDDGSTVDLETEGESYVFERQNFKIYSSEPSGCAPPLDIVDVNYDPPTTPPTDGPISAGVRKRAMELLFVVQIVFCLALIQ